MLKQYFINIQKWRQLVEEKNESSIKEFYCYINYIYTKAEDLFKLNY